MLIKQLHCNFFEKLFIKFYKSLLTFCFILRLTKLITLQFSNMFKTIAELGRNIKNCVKSLFEGYQKIYRSIFDVHYCSAF